MPPVMGVIIVVGASFILWNSFPKSVTIFLFLILAVLLINRWALLEPLWKGGQQQ